MKKSTIYVDIGNVDLSSAIKHDRHIITRKWSNYINIDKLIKIIKMIEEKCLGKEEIKAWGLNNMACAVVERHSFFF